MKKGICKICELETDLSFEHVPANSAFYSATYILKYQFDVATREWKATGKYPYGIGEYTLCQKCNNETGGPYGQAFCDFINHIANETSSLTEYRKPITIKYKGFLHRIIKQILVMFCSTNADGFTSKNNLKDYLLTLDSQDSNQEIRIYICLINRLSNFSSGIQGILKLHAQKTIIASEILFWPVGYIMSYEELNQNDIEGAYLTEITHWKDIDPNKRSETEITLYKNFRLTMFPLDYRSQSEIEAISGKPIGPPGAFPFIDYEL